MSKSIATLLLLLVSSFPAFSVEKSASHTREIWFDECGRCHGDDGKANTPLGRKLQIRDYSSREQQKTFSDEQAMQVISAGRQKDGKNVMPAYADQLSEEQRRDLLAYLRSMAKF
jgi:mono/diheme cytochrome c family protein